MHWGKFLIVACSVLATILYGHVQALPEEQVTVFHEVVILLDPLRFESRFAFAQELVDALRSEQRKIPIVASSSLVKAVIDRCQKDRVGNVPTLNGLHIHLFKDCFVYKHNEQDLMLIIPSESMSKLGVQPSEEAIRGLGFNVSHLTQINDVSLEGLASELRDIPMPSFEIVVKSLKVEPEGFIESLTSLFVTSMMWNDDKLHRWNIYFGGHGKPATALGAQDQNIVGLTRNAFFTLLDFFNDRLLAFYIHYLTCFSGGYNQCVVNKFLGEIRADCFVSCVGISETEVSVISPINFHHFFETIKTFSRKEKNYFRRCYEALISRATSGYSLSIPYVMNKLFFVRIPKVGVFKGIDVNNSVLFLTPFVARSYESFDAAIDATKYAGVIVSADRIYSKVMLGSKTLLVSQTPVAVSKISRVVRIFDCVKTDKEFNEFELAIARCNTTLGKTIFLIKELITKDRSVANYLIVCEKGTYDQPKYVSLCNKNGAVFQNGLKLDSIKSFNMIKQLNNDLFGDCAPSSSAGFIGNVASLFWGLFSNKEEEAHDDLISRVERCVEPVNRNVLKKLQRTIRAKQRSIKSSRVDNSD